VSDLAVTPLSTIIALARAGAPEQALRRYEAMGYGKHPFDPAALTVKGRLLKDAARRAATPERSRLYQEAANAYASAAKINAATYPLINAAALFLLSGSPAQAARLARDTLELLATRPDEPETPYYLTRPVPRRSCS
jgi:hypothetical protein